MSKLLFLPIRFPHFFTCFIFILFIVSQAFSADAFQIGIKEYIEKESLIIENASSLEEKLLGYLSRGDSYLIQGDFERAFQDYHEVYHLKDFLPVDDQDFFSFWSLLGEAISLSNQKEYFLADNRISEIEYSIQPLSWNYNSFPIPPVPPILGPEIVSPEWCEKCAQGLATAMSGYIKLVENARIQQRLLDIVRYLYTQAENCCKMSAFDPVRYNWKDCLGPLNEKRWLWKQKWELYKIPPDPSD